MDINTFSCTRCDFQCRTNLSRLIKHYFSVHSNEPGFNIGCGIEQCHKVFTNVKSLCLHMRHCHGKFYTKHIYSSNMCDCNTQLCPIFQAYSDHTGVETVQVLNVNDTTCSNNTASTVPVIVLSSFVTTFSAVCLCI